MTRATVPARATAGALAALLTLTACSDDGSSDGGTNDGSGSSAPADSGGTSTGSGDDDAETGGPPADDAESTTEAPAALELPRGGTEFFPEYRLFGYSGAPGSEGLGRLGIGDLDERVVEMEERGEEFADDREVMPVLELIATVVHGSPGEDGMFRSHLPDEVVQDHLDAARRHDGILLLNIQPGRADFLDELKYWEKWLEEPDVGVALDPEWAVEEGQIPGNVYGRTTGAELDECAAYLADIVEEHGLPEKVMVYHQVHTSVVQDEQDLEPHDGVAIIKSVDGIGPPSEKISTYNVVNENKPEHVVPGFKLFYEEDAEWGPLMTAEEVLALEPEPEYILFE